MKIRLSRLILLLPAIVASTQAADVTPSVSFHEPHSVTVSFTIPNGSKVYADSISATATLPGVAEVELTATNPPAPEQHRVDGLLESYYATDVSLRYPLPETFTNTPSISVGWQACTPTTCLLPTVKTFAPEVKTTVPETVLKSETVGLSRVLYGYASVDDFLNFLDPQPSGLTPDNPLEKARKRGGVLLLILAVMLGGFLLNFTPCVLPLIPVNLAILGIGTHQASRSRGFLIGSFFGLGIALSFGALGLVSVLTGTAFGTLQASPIFNAAIAIIFCLLAFAMLGVFTIDFSRLRNRFNPRRRHATNDAPSPLGYRLVGAFVAGAGSALLSGACVAPVLISTFVMATTLINTGHPSGAVLPLLLGLGMALPWPLLGGGVATLPRPGKWMNTVKYIFAAVFMGFAIKYAATAWKILLPEKIKKNDSAIAWLSDLDALARTRAENHKPVLLYLTATWCTSCREMANTTFQDKKVIAALAKFNAVKIDCTDFESPEIRSLMTRLQAQGLPFFALFEPDENEPQNTPKIE